jgi:hypothetical protein
LARPAARWASPLAARGRAVHKPAAHKRSLATQLMAVPRGGDMRFSESNAETTVKLVAKAEWAECVSALPAADKDYVELMLPGGWAAGQMAVLPGVRRTCGWGGGAAS